MTNPTKPWTANASARQRMLKVIEAAVDGTGDEAKDFAMDVIATWNSDPGLQGQFANFGAYLAWRQNERSKKGAAPEQSDLPRTSSAGTPESAHMMAERYRVLWNGSESLRKEFRHFHTFVAWKSSQEKF